MISCVVRGSFEIREDHTPRISLITFGWRNLARMRFNSCVKATIKTSNAFYQHQTWIEDNGEEPV